MDANVMNERALKCLIEGNFEEAQKLFFENAKKNPSHETYNNLGNFLIDEGLLCKNGRVRNAQKLGVKYLFKALEIRRTFITLCALAKSYNWALKSAKGNHREQELELLKDCFESAVLLNASNENRYNYLRALYLCGEEIDLLLPAVRELLNIYICKEGVSLYFLLLFEYSLIDEGLLCIERYGGYLELVDILMFYAKFGLFEKGYELCDEVKKYFGMDKYIISAVLECYVNTNHLEEASLYVDFIKENWDEIRNYSVGTDCDQSLLFDVNKTNVKRKEFIAEYSWTPPMIEICCYYGCPIHKTSFIGESSLEMS